MAARSGYVYLAYSSFLYPLHSGVLFGFRKPIVFIPVADISTYTVNTITQRTFNLVIITVEERHIEFDLIGNQEYDGIVAYFNSCKLESNNAAAVKEEQSDKGTSPLLPAEHDDDDEEDLDFDAKSGDKEVSLFAFTSRAVLKSMTVSMKVPVAILSLMMMMIAVCRTKVQETALAMVIKLLKKTKWMNCLNSHPLN